MNTNFRIRSSMAAALAALFAPSIVSAATWYVATTGIDTNPGTQQQPFRTIKRGLSVAQNGDAVLVANGTYSGIENTGLEFHGRDIILRSQGGAGNCIIEPPVGARRLLWLHQGETRLAQVDGFTFRAADVDGAVILSDSSPTIIRCVIEGSRARNGGGFQIESSEALIYNCAITGNGSERGGGMSIWEASPTIAHCNFLYNTATPNSIIQASSYGGAIDVVNASPTIINCLFANNSTGTVGQAGGLGGAIASTNSNLTVRDCFFHDNDAPHAGGAVHASGGSITISESTFFRNSAAYLSYGDGGAVSLSNGSNGTLANCLMIYNQAGRNGGAIAVGFEHCTLNVMHCTISENNCGSIGGIHGGISSLHNSLTMTNSIVFNNHGGELFGFESHEVNHCDLGIPYDGIGNITADPQFLNVDVNSRDFRLQPASPCLNAGTAAAPGLPDGDRLGTPRNLNGAPDMGAYEDYSGHWFVDGALGDDANPGSPVAPFRWVTRAVNAANNGETIFIKQGNYWADTPRITKRLRLLNWGADAPARIGQR